MPRRIPQPRGASSQPIRLGETWVEPEDFAYNTKNGTASGSDRRGFVRFPDGKLRMVRLGVADTYFSVPAKPSTGPIGFVTVKHGGTEFEFVPPVPLMALDGSKSIGCEYCDMSFRTVEEAEAHKALMSHFASHKEAQ